MFLRTTKRKNRDSSVVEYLQLAHNVRHPESRKPVAQIVHNFGRADELDRDILVRLCRSIARVCGVEIRDPLSEAAAVVPGFKPDKGPWPEGLKLLGSRSLGPVFVVEALWEKLGIGPLLARDPRRGG